jgi:folylpolyglutamate synthase/dihydropteroate synthase
VDLKRFLGNTAEGDSLNKAQIMDRFLNVIVAGDITPKTKEVLLKQLNEQSALVVPAMKSETERGNDSMAGEMMDAPPSRQERQQLARADANITDPVTKIVGLILGSPEFQRQ